MVDRTPGDEPGIRCNLCSGEVEPMGTEGGYCPRCETGWEILRPKAPSSGVRRAHTTGGQRDSSPAPAGPAVTVTLPHHIAAEVQIICEDDDSIAGDFAARLIADALDA